MNFRFSCSCPKEDCSIHGKCQECKDYHARKNNLSYCYRKKEKGEVSTSVFTLNQKIAIITLVFTSVWTLISILIAIALELLSPSFLAIFVTMTSIAWILIPLYLKKIKAGFILGIILLILGMFGLFASPGNPPWYTFGNPISVVKESSFILVGLLCIYFSYKSFGEISRGETLNE